MRLIITRHGETVENATGVIQGHLQGTLSDLGNEQAKKVALRLKNEQFDYIFSSDLDRARNTALHIKEHHPKAIFTLTNNLRETYLGSWQGKTKKELGITEAHRPPYPEDAETIDQIYQRAKSFLGTLNPKYIGKNLLLVGHNGINKAIIAVLTGKNSEGIKQIESQHNTGVNIFELVNGVYVPLVLNCKKHLEE